METYTLNPNEIKRVQQITIEDSHSKTNIRATVKAAILEMDDPHAKYVLFACKAKIFMYQMGSYYESKNKRIQHIESMDPEDLAIDLFIAILPIVNKSPIQSIATRYAKSLDFPDVFDGIKTASEIIGVCAKTSLYQVWLNPITLQAQIALPPETMQFIAKTQYLNPMVCRPNAWENNKNGGYVTVCQSVILGKHNHHEKKQALDALNIAQKVEWELDMNMVNYIEKPKNPCVTQKQVDGHIQQTTNAMAVYQDLVDQGNSFYFVWRFDFRGRMYNMGYYVSIQSTDYKKALLNFANKQVING